MEEYWVCQHCRSLNRASAGKCYSCKQKYGSRPDDAGSAVKNAAQAAPSSAALPTMADFGAAASQQALAAQQTYVPQQTYAAQQPSAAPPPYLARPVAVPSLGVAGPAVGGASGRRGARPPNPVSAVRRRIASSLALRQSVSVNWLGYLTVWLLTVLVVAGSALVFTVLPALTDMLQNVSLTGAWAHLTADQQSLAKTLAIVFGAVGIATLLCFSVFLGLTTHNATGLGADMPILTPYGAGIIWPVLVWTQARIAVGMIVPAALIWLDYPIPGLIAAIVAIEIAQRHMDDPFGWLTRPYRHLPDLYAKLGTEGSIESPMASLWSACYRAASVLAIVTYALPMLAVVLVFASDALGRDSIPGWQTTGLGPAQLGVALLVGSLLACTLGAVALLVPITVGLIRRQRTRRTLVRVGRSRSWLSRPGQGGYAPAPPGQPESSYDDYDDDRVIEHFPRQAPVDPGFGQAGGPGFGQGGSPGFGQGGSPDFGQGGSPGFGQGGSPDFGPNGDPWGNAGPDQASLNSPSTTSSFPWSGGPPSPPD